MVVVPLMVMGSGGSPFFLPGIGTLVPFVNVGGAVGVFIETERLASKGRGDIL